MALKIVLGHGCRMRNGNTFGAHKNYLYATHKRHRLTNMPVVVQRRQAGGRMRMRVRSPRKINGNRQQSGRQKEQAKTTTATRTVQSSLSLSPGPHKYRHAFADRIKIVALVFNARTRRYRSSHSSRRSSSSSTLFRNWLPGLLDSRRRWARGLRLKWQPGTVVS